MNTADETKQLDRLAEELLEQMTKHELLQCARLLALHLGDYIRRFGHLPATDMFGLLAMAEIDQAQNGRLRDALQILIRYLSRIHEPPRSTGEVH